MLEHWSASKNLCISEAIREKLFGELLITRMGEEYLERSVKQKEEAKKGRFSHLAK